MPGLPYCWIRLFRDMETARKNWDIKQAQMLRGSILWKIGITFVVLAIFCVLTYFYISMEN